VPALVSASGRKTEPGRAGLSCAADPAEPALSESRITGTFGADKAGRIGSPQWKDTGLDSITLEVTFILPRAGVITAPKTR